MDKESRKIDFLEQRSNQLKSPKEIDDLRRLIQEGIDSGPGIDSEIVFSRLRKKYEDMARKDSG